MSHITPQILRVATLLLTLCVASAAPADSLRVAADLDAASDEKTRAAAERALADQISAMQARTEAQLTEMIANRVGVQLAAATNDALSRLLATQQLEVERNTELSDHRTQNGSITLKKGADMGHHRFDEPFGQTPKIALGIRQSDSVRRVVVLRVVSVDEAGFDYVIRAPEDAWSQDLTVHWVAFASSATGS